MEIKTQVNLARLFVGFVMAGVLSAFVYCQDAASVTSLFSNEGRQKAVWTIETHLQKHKDCEAKVLLETLKTTRYVVDPTMSSKRLAYTFPSIENLYKYVFVSARREWKLVEVVVVSIHEATHNTRQGKGWLCGPDSMTHFNRSILMANPPCRLFGEVQYNSEQITQIIEKHFKEELSSLGDK